MQATERDMLDLLVKRYSRTYQNVTRWVYAEHVARYAGFHGPQRIIDFVAMDVWPGVPYMSKLALHAHEVKVSRSDWLTELRSPEKAGAFLPYVDHFWLVVSDPAIVKPAELPEGWGLMVKAGDKLRVKTSAPRRDAEQVPKDLVAMLMRGTMKTAARQGQSA